MKLLGTAKSFFKERGVETFVDHVFYDKNKQPYIIGLEEDTKKQLRFYFIITLSKKIKGKMKASDLGLKGALIWETTDSDGNIIYKIGKAASESTFKSYEDLLSLSENLNYSEKLKALEWREKREAILNREDNVCEICKNICVSTLEGNKGKSDEDLKKSWANVHHTYYVKGCLPWQYPNESLQLLCNGCHQEIHTKKKIMVYQDFEFHYTVKSQSCFKCEGTGYLPEFYYYYDGVCFDCDGTGYTDLK